jgi:hypothetical protein
MPGIAIQFLPNFGRVTDDVLVHLRQFPSLRVVDLPNKRMVTDAGLEPLNALRHLRRLQMGHPAITDAGLDHLKDLAELEELNVRGTGISRAALVRLKQRLPRLRVGGP